MYKQPQSDEIINNGKYLISNTGIILRFSAERGNLVWYLSQIKLKIRRMILLLDDLMNGGKQFF